MRKGLEVMDLSDLARRNTISLEVKKDGLTQRQSGDWQLRLTIAAIDMDSRITQAPMGTRFACVLVEVNDDETPVDHASMEQRQVARPRPGEAGGHALQGADVLGLPARGVRVRRREGGGARCRLRAPSLRRREPQ
ncbi:hypothetical protein G6321_00028020 [Bradyrhizobium barranii subsp. barranii]|uniref:Uncharacterized protein n=1 Tax=Bradyrhizobium barranii subsp. barranii TaxID=2823807 RepID=A0A7Z0TQE8_9BRAD|nr:hypothetical protein [Bradyrhizobium barranii]UGX98754.1 hypothetical protein G6321_00028020 [Bradyrhizobium barranii subsp. barranii]